MSLDKQTDRPEQKPEQSNASTALLADVRQDLERQSSVTKASNGQSDRHSEPKELVFSSVFPQSDSPQATTIKHQGLEKGSDGSQRQYGADGNLERLTYPDGTYREFKWEGGRLSATRTRDGRWFDRTSSGDRDQPDAKESWKERQSGQVWQGEIRVNNDSGAYSIKALSGTDQGITKTTRTNGDSEQIGADGTREVSHPGSKGKERYDAGGNLTRMVTEDGTVRNFGWSDDHKLDSIQVQRPDGQVFNWQNKNGQWSCNGEASNYKFSVDSQTGKYSWTDDQSINHHITSVGPEKVEKNGKQLEVDQKTGAIIDRNEKEGYAVHSINGYTTQIDYADGKTRKFGYQNGKLSSIDVIEPGKDGATTRWQRVGDNEWKCGNETAKGDFKVEGDKYTYYDAKEKKTTIRMPNGFRREESPSENKVVESMKDQITRISVNGNQRAFERDSSGKVTAVRENGFELRKQADGSWKRFSADGKEAPDGIERRGTPDIDKSNGTTAFLTADGSVVRSKLGEKPEKFTAPAEIAKKIESSTLDDAAKIRFVSNLHDFQQRTEISADEKQKTVQQIEKLMDSQGNTTFKHEDCQKLAEQLAFHVAHPENDSQGQHPTCNVSDVRICLERQSPSTFAKFITESVTTGQFKTADGTTIRPPRNESLLPGKEESKWPPEAGSRSWVGKISDVMMLNTHWQRRATDTNNNAVQRGSLYYDEERPTGQDDSGSRIYKYEQRGDQWYRTEMAKAPSIYAGGILDVYKQISGKPEENRMLVHSSRTAGEGVSVIKSVDELKEKLQQGPYPKIVQVQNNILQGQQPDGKDHEHVVVVVGYDPKTGKVAIDNSHGASEDMLTPDKQIPVERLFDAMQAQVPRGQTTYNVVQNNRTLYYNNAAYQQGYYYNGYWYNNGYGYSWR